MKRYEFYVGDLVMAGSVALVARVLLVGLSGAVARHTVIMDAGLVVAVIATFVGRAALRRRYPRDATPPKRNQPSGFRP